MMPRLAVVHAGNGTWSTSRELALRLLAAVREAGPVEARVIGVWELLGPIHLALSGSPWTPALRGTREAVAAADGIIAVTPVVHGAYSGPFKSYVDLLGVEPVQGKPVLIAASGGSSRHCLALDHVIRPLFVCLRCAVVPTAVYATPEECAPERVAPGLSARIERAAGELAAAMAANLTRPEAVVGGA